MSEQKRLSDNELEEFRKSIYVSAEWRHFKDTDVELLLNHIAAIESELAAAKAEGERLRQMAKQFAEANTKLRRIACHVPGRVWMKASEECGYGNTVSINDHKIDEAWLEFTSVKPKSPST
jgi:hypothetical protein